MKTSTRKIAHVPGLGLMAMPASYDPAKVTREDAKHDGAICSVYVELSHLRREAKAVSGMAAQTVTEDVTDEQLSELAAIDEHWNDAVSAALRGDLDEVRSALTFAQSCARSWGSSQHEDTALAMLPE